MDQILFRAKRIFTGEWVYGNYVHLDVFKGFPTEHKIFEVDIECEYNVDRSTVGQFIGEYDKGGNMIFEGDILQTDEAGWVGKVVFNKAMFVIVDNNGGFSSYPNWNKCEIIGNVYDKPELLK